MKKGVFLMHPSNEIKIFLTEDAIRRGQDAPA